MFKKLIKPVVLLAAVFVVVSAIPAAKAAITYDPTAGRVVLGDSIGIACSAGHFVSVFQVGTLNQLVAAADCDPSYDATGVIVQPGTYYAVETSTNVNDTYGNTVNDADYVGQSTFQVVPDFASTSAPQDITGSAADGLVSGVGDFLVSKLAAVLAVLAALIGLGFLLSKVRHWISRKA